MVGESFHPSGCWGEDSNHIRLGATVQKLLRLFASAWEKLYRNANTNCPWPARTLTSGIRNTSPSSSSCSVSYSSGRRCPRSSCLRFWFGCRSVWLEARSAMRAPSLVSNTLGTLGSFQPLSQSPGGKFCYRDAYILAGLSSQLQNSKLNKVC